MLYQICVFLKNCFKLEDNCFTMLCWPLPPHNQPETYPCPLPLELSFLPTPTPAFQVITEHQADLPVSYRQVVSFSCWIMGRTVGWVGADTLLAQGKHFHILTVLQPCSSRPTEGQSWRCILFILVTGLFSNPAYCSACVQ